MFGSLTVPNYSLETAGSIAYSKPSSSTTSTTSAYTGSFNTSNSSSTICNA